MKTLFIERGGPVGFTYNLPWGPQDDNEGLLVRAH